MALLVVAERGDVALDALQLVAHLHGELPLAKHPLTLAELLLQGYGLPRGLVSLCQRRFALREAAVHGVAVAQGPCRRSQQRLVARNARLQLAIRRFVVAKLIAQMLPLRDAFVPQ